MNDNARQSNFNKWRQLDQVQLNSIKKDSEISVFLNKQKQSFKKNMSQRYSSISKVERLNKDYLGLQFNQYCLNQINRNNDILGRVFSDYIVMINDIQKIKKVVLITSGNIYLLDPTDQMNVSYQIEIQNINSIQISEKNNSLFLINLKNEQQKYMLDCHRRLELINYIL